MYLETANIKGSIEVICGSMFSGKTEELIRRMKRASIAGLQCKIFKPTTDTRYSKTCVVSHDKNQLSSIMVTTSDQILALIDNSTRVVGIDEAQFFDKNIIQVCQTLSRRNVRVIVAGLDMDFLGRPFGPMGDLMCIADDVTKVHAICTHCGNLAQFSHRLNNSNNLVQLGEKDMYEPLCRQCYDKINHSNSLAATLNESISNN